jgi:hypothetical protein
MPKIGIAKCLNQSKHQEGVEEMLKIIAKKYDKRRGDVVIAYEEDISVYAVRMWLTRPIPSKHWKTLARLSGYSLTKVESVARENFDMAAID